MRTTWTIHRGLAAGAALSLLGCHAPFLGEDWQAESLPLRQVNAWPLLEQEEDPATGESRTLALGGFLYRHEEPQEEAVHSAAFPFYWHAEEGQAERTRVPPLWWYTRTGPEDVDASLLGVGPVAFYASHQEPGARRSHLFPFWWSSQEGDSSSFACLPGLYHGRQGEEAHGNLLGVLADWRSGPGQASSGSVLGLGPLALGGWERDGERSRSHALPLWYSSRDARSEVNIAFPLVWRFADPVQGSARTLVFPLAHHHDDGRGARRLDVLWPLYSQQVGPAREGWAVLGWLATFERTDPESSDLRVLYKLFRHRRDGGRRETSFAPLFTVTKDAERDYASFSLLGPLWRTERTGARRTHRLFHFIRFGG